MVKLKEFAEKLRKEKVKVRRADVNIGKRGLHQGVVEEIKRVLENRGCVKIRILKNARNIVTEKSIVELANGIGANVIDKRGYTYILISRKIISSKYKKILHRTQTPNKSGLPLQNQTQLKTYE